MTSKEVLEYLRTCKFCKIVMGTDYENDDRYFTLYDVFSEEIETIQKDLDRLEKLEKENQELKERYKHRAETSNDLCKTVKQYEKAFDILENKIVNILILKYCIAKGGGVETYNLHYTTEEPITQEEYELLKEVFGNGI